MGCPVFVEYIFPEIIITGHKKVRRNSGLMFIKLFI